MAATVPPTLHLNAALQQAENCRQAGLLQEAERLFRAILQAQPNNPEANYSLGLMALQANRPAAGLPHFKAALEANPKHGRYRLGYIDALIWAGQKDAARKVLAQGRQRGMAGAEVEAIAARLAGERKIPKHPGAVKRTPPAPRATRQPGDQDIHALVALFNAGRHSEMESRARLTCERYPDSGVAWKALGAALQMQGKDALAVLQRAAELLPDDAEVHSNLGNTLREIGQLDGAVASCRRALELKPDLAEAHNNLGNALKDLWQLDSVVASYTRALKIKPDYAEAHSNLGNVLKDLGQFDSAVASYAKALEIKPDFAEAYDNLLFALNYHPDKSGEEIYAAYREYDERFCLPYREKWRPHGNDRETQRRLKVGYVSPDFRLHSCRHFLEPLLAHHDKTQVEIYAYAELPREDAVTARYRGYVDHWVPTRGMSDGALSERIRADGIDILVDLAGHTAGTARNRLSVFARKPAPVSLSWLGYGYTTGLGAIDYLLTDAVSAPPGSENLFSEAPWRLAPTGYVYRPAEGMGEVSPLPALTRGHVTFGTLTRAVRINHRTIRVWAEILKRVEGSRLVIDSGNFRDSTMQDAMAEKFAACGVTRDRLEIGYHSPPWEVLRGLDIGLDCFPHNSGTTLFETLYMGVPFVTLAGRPSVGRLGSSILEGVGHPSLIACTEDGYIEKAVALASNLPKLAALRGGLRREMETGPLMDEAGFARKVEAAYREMFGKWARE